LLERAMVGFDDVVQVFADPMFRVVGQLTFSLQPTDRFGVRAELICND